MPRKASLSLAPRKRGGFLPEGEARGGGFALSELPHPFRDLFLAANIAPFSPCTNFLCSKCRLCAKC